jgi:hypothetical protein
MSEPFENSEAWKSVRLLTNEVYHLGQRHPKKRFACPTTHKRY